MKKAIFLLAAAATLLNMHASAKTGKGKINKKLYGRLGIGYAFVHAGQSLISETVNSYSGNGSGGVIVESGTIKKYSFGAGFNATLAAGYKLMPNVAVELGLNYGIVPYKGKSTYIDLSDNAYSNGTQYARNPLYVIPAFVISTNTKPLDIYTRLGVVIPVISKVTYEETTTQPGYINEYRDVVSFSFGVGFQGALGVKCHLTKKTGIWLEATGISMNRWTRSEKETEDLVNGVSQLNGGQTIHFGTSYGNNSNSGGPAYSVAFSSVGLAAGITIGL